MDRHTPTRPHAALGCWLGVAAFPGKAGFGILRPSCGRAHVWFSTLFRTGFPTLLCPTGDVKKGPPKAGPGLYASLFVKAVRLAAGVSTNRDH